MELTTLMDFLKLCKTKRQQQCKQTPKYTSRNKALVGEGFFQVALNNLADLRSVSKHRRTTLHTIRSLLLPFLSVGVALNTSAEFH